MPLLISVFSFFAKPFIVEQLRAKLYALHRWFSEVLALPKLPSASDIFPILAVIIFLAFRHSVCEIT
jgi:hypothetical protein